jgi:hypothetical protein
MHIFRGSNLCYIKLWLSLIDISYDHISFMSMTNVFSSILSYLVIELKWKWSIWQRRRFHSTPSVLSTLCRYSAISPFWYNLHSYIVYQRGRESKKGLYFTLSIRFWRFMPKGEKVLAQSKRTAPPHHAPQSNFKRISQLVWFSIKN